MNTNASATTTVTSSSSVDSAGIVQSRFPEPGGSISDWVEASDYIAEVSVTRMGEFQFNTPDGQRPTPLPNGRFGNWAELQFATTVTIKIDTLFKQTYEVVSGFVVIEGEDPGGSGPKWPIPKLGFGGVGESGIVFMQHSPLDTVPPMKAFQKADEELSQLGGGYEFGVVKNYYRYDGTDAISFIDDRTISKDELIGIIQQAQ